MDKNAHYLIVGLFVILVSIAGFMFAGWLYNDQSSQQAKHFEIHFSESVDGLEEGSEVRYMGIKVGYVEDTFLLVNQANKVGVKINVNEETPIFSNTVATLRSQGVTGLSYINLVPRNTEKQQAITHESSSELPIISSAPSDIGGLIQALPELQDNLNHLITGANQALSKENLQNFSLILENINTLVTDANHIFSDENMNNLASLLESLNQTAQAGPKLATDLRKTTQKLNTLLRHMDQLVSHNKAGVEKSINELQLTLKNISTMTKHYNQLAVQLNKTVTTNEDKMNEIISDGGHDLKQLLIESRRTAASVRQLSEKLNQNPSQIIYESTSQGVKIPR